ncbi:MAG TPA: hypothetical protein VHV49_00095 [Pseudonocardiaceae bacterium]|jgi:hypothetical protein|nr:hypothetical protein [Pseudonocardiaceae bacterium]
MAEDVARLCARLIRFDTTNRGGGDAEAMARGVDERVPVAGLEFAVRVLDRFLSG